MPRIMVIKVEKVISQDIKPGELFSIAKMEHWDSVNERTGDRLPIGEKVYIRTNAPTPDSEKDQDLVRLTIEHKDAPDHASYHLDVGPDDEEGNPTVEQSPNPNCPYCAGDLEDEDSILHLQEEKSNVDPQEEVQCPNCEGQAEVDGETCTGCNGTGTLAKEDFDASGH